MVKWTGTQLWGSPVRVSSLAYPQPWVPSPLGSQPRENPHQASGPCPKLPTVASRDSTPTGHTPLTTLPFVSPLDCWPSSSTNNLIVVPQKDTGRRMPLQKDHSTHLAGELRTKGSRSMIWPIVEL